MASNGKLIISLTNGNMLGSNAAGSIPTGMRIGGGTNGLAVWANAWQFQDVMKNSRGWNNLGGIGNFEINRSDHVVNVDGTILLQKLVAADVIGDDIPPGGVYTVRKTNGSANLEYGVSNSGAPGATGWQTGSEVTFTHTQGDNIILYVRSSDGLPASLTGFEILVPGFVEGQTFRTEWYNFFAAMNLDTIRFMDWSNTNDTYIEEWDERTQVDALSYTAARHGKTFMDHDEGTIVHHVPYEVQIELCNLLGANIWINFQTRCSLAYAQAYGALINSDLDVGLECYAEYSNETWNWLFNDNVRWSSFLGAEIREAAGTVGSNVLPINGTAPAEGASLFLFKHPDGGLRDAPGSINFGGVTYRAINVGGGTFELVTDDDVDTPVNIAADMDVIYWTELSENPDYGDIEVTAERTGVRSVQLWDAFEIGLASSHTYHRVLAGVSDWVSINERKAGVNGANGAYDYMAIAPYFDFHDTYTPGLTNAQLAALDLTAANNRIAELQDQINSPSNFNLICYEFNNHTIPVYMTGGTLEERTAVMDAYYKSPECITVLQHFLQEMADDGIELVCWFVADISNGGGFGFWGVQDSLSNPNNVKYQMLIDYAGIVEAS
jgi:hypothetical protein